MLKDLGTIALFLGVFLNAYHYYKLHIYSKDEKNFDMILKFVEELKSIRNRVIKLEKKKHKFSQKLSQYTNSMVVSDENGSIVPKSNIPLGMKTGYKAYLFEQKTYKVYQDYIFILELKDSMQTIKFVDEVITQKFIKKLEREIENRLHNLFSTFCWWDKVIEEHNIPQPIISQQFDCDNIENLFKKEKNENS